MKECDFFGVHGMGAGTGGAGWASAHPGKKSGWAWPTLEILAVV